MHVGWGALSLHVCACVRVMPTMTQVAAQQDAIGPAEVLRQLAKSKPEVWLKLKAEEAEMLAEQAALDEGVVEPEPEPSSVSAPAASPMASPTAQSRWHKSFTMAAAASIDPNSRGAATAYGRPAEQAEETAGFLRRSLQNTMAVMEKGIAAEQTPPVVESSSETPGVATGTEDRLTQQTGSPAGDTDERLPQQTRSPTGDTEEAVEDHAGDAEWQLQVRALMEGVGASEVAARQALIASEGDMDRAIEMLLA
jgi:hypothetical protein